ncbi:ACT domain-containing protein, partial [bacterium]|nr:ACT domain-containing protein [bacterium]
EEEYDIFPENSSRIVISIFGVDNPGVIASFSQALAEENISIHDVSQRILGKLFTLFMVVNLGERAKEYASIKKKLISLAGELKVKIYIQHESIFQYMHRI